MSKRFQNINKYRNAVGRVAKREDWYSDLPLGTSSGSDNAYLVQASCNWLAVKSSRSEGSMIVLPLEKTGKKCAEEARVFHAHGPSVSDWHFSDFDQDLLASGGKDGRVKLWKIPQEGEPSNQAEFSIGSRRVDVVRFHPTAEQIITTLGNDGKMVGIWDVTKSARVLDINAQSSPFHSFSWKADGTLLGTSGKDVINVWDPRAQEKLAMSGTGHEGIKGSRVVWLGQTNYMFTVGTDKSRTRQYSVWDSRDLSKPLKNTSIDSSTGITIPLYDEDTETVYLVSRGEATIHALQFSDMVSGPTVAPSGTCSVGTQLYGATVLPKLALDVMQGEIARVVGVAENAAIPISFQVPRKQYLDFHSDLFPDTKGQELALSGSEWLGGKSTPVAKVSLDPSKRCACQTKPASNNEQRNPVNEFGKPSFSSEKDDTSRATKPTDAPKNADQNSKQTPAAEPALSSPSSTTTPVKQPVTGSEAPAKQGTLKSGATQAVSFNYIEGKPYQQRTRYHDLRNLSTDKSGAFDLIQANEKFMAVSLSGPGGQVGIIPVSCPGRLPTHIPCVQCNSAVSCFTFDPFDHHIIAAACVDNKIRFFRIPDTGLEEDTTEPFALLTEESLDKISAIAFHPTARNVLLVASGATLHVWDTQSQSDRITIADAHEKPILSCTWSPDGKKIATVDKDSKIRVIEPRTGRVLATGTAHDSVRPSKLLWLGETNRLASVGFGRGSMREILLFNAEDLAVVTKITIDMSPSVMSAHYDADCRLIFIAGRGDRTIHIYMLEKDDTLKQLSKFEYDVLQQGFAFLPKRLCDVRKTEVAKFFRLTPTFVEPVGVRVPRARAEFFQDDIFVDTLDTEHPALENEEWFDGIDKTLATLSLRPSDMVPLSSAPPPPQIERSKFKLVESKKMVSDEERRQEAMDRMFATAKDVGNDDTLALPTDTCAEVADEEWDD